MTETWHFVSVNNFLTQTPSDKKGKTGCWDGRWGQVSCGVAVKRRGCLVFWLFKKLIIEELDCFNAYDKISCSCK